MNRPLVSAIIPTYNYGHFVTAAVDSALAQTYADIEILVVDDGSTDDTRRRLAPYESQIRYIHQPNAGLPAARNTGIRLARGELLAFLDADDLWHPQKTAIQVAYLAAHPETGLVAAADTGGRAPPPWPLLPESAGVSAKPVSAEDLILRSRFGPCGVIVRRACLDQVGGFDEELRSAEDRDMWIRVARVFPVAQLLAPLWWYRLHDSSMSRAARRMEVNEMRVLRRALSKVAAPRRFWLGPQSVSQAAFGAAYMYDATGHRREALARMLQAFVWWPLPYRRQDVTTRLARPKRLAMILWRVLGGRRKPAENPRGASGS